jgi:hypothetical protein
MALPSFGSFDDLNLPQMEREMYETGVQAVSAVEGGWEFLKTYAPPEDKGFMFSPSEGKRKEIDAEIEKRYPGHSGGSYGQTMRTLEFIAKQGWDTFAKDILVRYGPPPVAQLTKTVETVKTVDRFLGTSPPLELSAFADAIQKDAGMRARIPDIDAQASALKRFAEGKLSYAEMRSLCG